MQIGGFNIESCFLAFQLHWVAWYCIKGTREESKIICHSPRTCQTNRVRALHYYFFVRFKFISIAFAVNTKDTSINNDERSDFLRSDEELSSTSVQTDTIRAAVPAVTDIEDLYIKPSTSSPAKANDFCSSSFGCNGQSRQHCNELIKDYKEQQQVDFNEFYINTQSLRHTVLLILLLCSMFVVSWWMLRAVAGQTLLNLFKFQSISLSIWTLIMEGMSGIYVELSFLEAFLNFGQCILVSACFITDTDELWKKSVKYWSKIRWCNKQMRASRQRAASLSEDAKTRFICDQFIRHHLENCKNAIGSDRFAHSRLYNEAFYGTTLVNWLITVGLATDRRDAINYASYLIDGGILHHINDVKNFYDRDIIYCFNI